MGLIGVNMYLDTNYKTEETVYSLSFYCHRINHGFEMRGHYNSHFKKYYINYYMDSEKRKDILKKSKLFIKNNKIYSKKKFLELETLFKLQVLL